MTPPNGLAATQPASERRKRRGCAGCSNCWWYPAKWVDD